MDETLDQEREDLEALLATPGWTRFLRFVQKEWLTGRGYRARMRAALGVTDGPQFVEMTATEIEKLLTWPGERLKQLKETRG